MSNKLDDAFEVIDLIKSQWDLDVLHDQLDYLKAILNFESDLDEWKRAHGEKNLSPEESARQDVNEWYEEKEKNL